MGACFNYTVFDGILTESQLKTKFSEYKGEQEYEHGHGAYNGTLATTHGLDVEKKCFQTEREAHDYIADNTSKWGNARAVQFKDAKTVAKKEPTFNGKIASADTLNSWLCIRSVWKQPKNEIVTADQLTAPQKERVLKAYEAYDAAIREENTLRDEQFRLVRRLQNLEDDFTTEDFSRLKKNRPSLKKATANLAKQKDKFIEIDKKIGDKLYKYQTEEVGTKWIVGGWCAE